MLLFPLYLDIILLYLLIMDLSIDTVQSCLWILMQYIVISPILFILLSIKRKDRINNAVLMQITELLLFGILIGYQIQGMPMKIY